MDSRRRLLLTMKKQRGTATPDELAEMRDSVVFVGGRDGGGVLVAPAPLTMEEFLAKYGDTRHPVLPGDEREEVPNGQ